MKTGRKPTHGFARRGKKRSKEYNSWSHMIGRCTSPTNLRYPTYGAVGITVCDRWRKFANFLADMGKAPSKKHTLDRYPDKRGNYEPNNCRWATPKQQARNMISNRMLTFRGKTLRVSEWAETIGVNRGLIANRIDAGWSVEEALTTPILDKGGNLPGVYVFTEKRRLAINKINERRKTESKADSSNAAGDKTI